MIRTTLQKYYQLYKKALVMKPGLLINANASCKNLQEALHLYIDNYKGYIPYKVIRLNSLIIIISIQYLNLVFFIYKITLSCPHGISISKHIFYSSTTSVKHTALVS